MQKPAEVCIRRPVFAAMIVLSLVVVGAASYARLGVDRFPSVDLPTVSVRTELAGASAEEVETQVTREIEQVVNTVQGIRELRSICGPGQSIVIRPITAVRDALVRQNADLPGAMSPPASASPRSSPSAASPTRGPSRPRGPAGAPLAAERALLLIGEPGPGKEPAAQSLHARGARPPGL
ncbi:MAG: efflux RND transporter permease subunit [candidate division NC10 bacterium]